MSTRDELQARLHDLGIVPSKAMGQNFLTDPTLAGWIARQIEPGPEDTVVEIGPGMGALTDTLAELAGRLILIEFDRKLAHHMRERFAERENVEVIEADAAQFDIRPLFKYGPVKVIGNLPYSAGGAIMRNFLQNPTPVAEALFMLQTEVAERICSDRRSKQYGVLTLRVQVGWEPTIIRTLPPEPFYPMPAIDSSVLRLTPRDPISLPAHDGRLFDQLIRQGFSQRRKQVKKLLASSLPDALAWEEICDILGVLPTARAEEISLEQWVALTNCCDPHPLKAIAQGDDEMFDVVDDENAVIAQAPRAEVHARNLLHRAVHVFVFNARGELFLQKRSMLKDKSPGLWDSSAAGHLDAGDDYPETAGRELREELGIDAPARYVADIGASERTGWEFVQLFEATHNGPFKYPASEISGGHFFPMEEIRAWAAARPQDFASGFHECLKAWDARADT